MESQATTVKKIKSKSPSQKVRAILFLYWELNMPTETFEEFYDKEMDRIINSLKKTYLK